MVDKWFLIVFQGSAREHPADVPRRKHVSCMANVPRWAEESIA